jgi:hypothetical protein
MVEFYYYLAFPEVQRYLLLESKLDKSTDHKKIMAKIRQKIKQFIENNQKISITSIADDLELDRGSLIAGG